MFPFPSSFFLVSLLILLLSTSLSLAASNSLSSTATCHFPLAISTVPFISCFNNRQKTPPHHMQLPLAIPWNMLTYCCALYQSAASRRHVGDFPEGAQLPAARVPPHILLCISTRDGGSRLYQEPGNHHHDTHTHTQMVPSCNDRRPQIMILRF